MATASELIAQLDILKQKIADSVKAPVLPVVTVAHEPKREGDILSVGWSLLIKGAHSGLVVNVEHSNTATGGIEKHAWSIPPMATEHGRLYPYKYYVPGMTFPDVRFRVLAGEGYTTGTPSEAIEKLTAAPTPEPIPIPAPEPIEPPQPVYNEPVDVYPNPFTTSLTLRIVSEVAGNAKVTMIRRPWKTYFSGEVPLIKGINSIDMSKYLTNAPAGTYEVMVKIPPLMKLQVFPLTKK